ncbi:MAG: 16S rRNA (uracil(1498)-N(3))-methyltransferase, partial [Selenomonadaceae bacterium]|nr:16S rRNA (uracil(1498)-N(3))-methyltransferase [Selenomonadaceae bacterium]
MKRIFLEDLTAAELKISGQDARHLAYSLRARRGERIRAVDRAGNCAVIELIDFNNDSVKARRIGEMQKVIVERKIILADCLPKQNRFETIIEKATELGVDKIQPLISERTIARPKDKLERWRRIAKESSEQCGRDTIPEIGDVRKLDDWLKEIFPLKENWLFLFCWEEEKVTTVREVLSENKNSNVIVLIGPEGGFSEREVLAIKTAGGVSASLGSRILKTDTAAISVLAMINY